MELDKSSVLMLGKGRGDKTEGARMSKINRQNVIKKRTTKSPKNNASPFLANSNSQGIV